ncbi:MAG: hypothetical protein CMN30_08355 [Sandaracinus sp.]|nr:hypothetical protein [Sandaracinus sp.]
MSAAEDRTLEPMRREVTAAARRFQAAGYSVVPPREDGSKAPLGKWKTFQKRPADAAQIERWYGTGGRCGVGFVTGAASGNLEALDFDRREELDAFLALADETGLGELVRRVFAGYSESTPRGFHAYWRCPVIEGNLKLANGANGSVLVETRGEGGYVIAAPSFGPVNAAGDYVLRRGGPESIVTITPEERDDLLALARSLDRSVRREANRGPRVAPPEADGDRPGDAFNREASWSDVLAGAGWTPVFTTAAGVTHWRRPGKSRGTSATTNYAGADLFYPFTTSTGFEAERGYSKFAVYADLNHGGDYSAAARDLRAKGYGSDRTASEPRLRVVAEADLPSPEEEDDEGIPAHLFEIPGYVGDLQRYIARTAPRFQPELALAAAIVGTGTLVGRKVQTWTGLRTNQYVIGLADTGAGKEHNRQAVRRVFEAAGARAMTRVDKVTSDAALIAQLEESPSSAAFFDEFGLELQQYNRHGSLGAVEAILALFGVAGGTFAKTYASDRKSKRRGTDTFIVEPCLSIFATSTPQTFYAALESNAMSSGFLNRFLHFEAPRELPRRQEVHVRDREVPLGLVEQTKVWLSFGQDSSEGATIADLMDPTTGEPLLPGQRKPGRVLTVEPSDEALRLYHEVGDWQDARMNELRRSDDPTADLYARLQAHAAKLALTRAAGRALFPEETVIEAADMKWGVELATYCCDLMRERARAHIADSAYHQVVKKAAEFIRTKGKVTRSAYTTKLTHIDRRIREDVLQTLIESGQVEEVKVDNGGSRGPKATVFVWIGGAS